jgi:hypothetical protein
MTDPPIFPAAFAGFVLIAGLGSAFFLFARNARLKRRLWPWWLAATGLMFLVFAWYISQGTAWIYLILLPAVVFFSYVNLRRVRFCDRCGRTVMPTTGFAAARFCSSCGAELKQGSDLSRP